MSLKDKRFVAQPREERLLVPEWETEVIVRGLMASERNRMGEIAQQRDNGASKAEAYAIIQCVLDPETHKPVYEDADRDQIMTLESDFVNRFARAIMRLSGLLPDAPREAEKN